MNGASRLWIVVMGAAMAAYGGAIVCRMRSPNILLAVRDVLLLSVVIAVVGVCALVTEIVYQPDDRRPNFLWRSIDAYRAAWSKLWRTKWLLWVYGTMAVVLALSSVFSGVMTLWIRGAQSGPIYGDSQRLTFFQKLMDTVRWSMPNWIGHVSRKFFPATEHFSWGLATDLAVIGLAISIVPAIQRLRQNVDLSRKIGFFSLCLAVLAVGGVVGGTRLVMQVQEYRQEMHSVPSATSAAAAREAAQGPATPSSAKAGAIANPPGTFGGRRMGPSPTEHFFGDLASMAMSIILGAILAGGVIGSLVRNRKSEDVSRSTFVEDAVRYFEPIAGLMLICVLPGILSLAWRGILVAVMRAPDGVVGMRYYNYLSFVPLFLISPALLFAPYAIVAHNTNCWEAALQSLRLWKKAWWGVLCLIATGAFFYALVNGPVETLWSATRDWRIKLIFSPVFSIIGVAGSVLILLAVWEFYQANVTDREPVSAAE